MAEAVENSQNKADQGWSYESLGKALKEGRLSEDEATDVFLDLEIKRDFYDMDPDDVGNALDKGKISVEQAQRFLDRTKNPVWWGIKDHMAGIGKGIEKAYENTSDVVSEATGIKPAIQLFELVTGKKSWLKADNDYIDLPEPETGTAKLAQGITQFATVFIPGTQAMKAAQLTRGITKSKYLLQFADKFPKLPAALDSLAVNMSAGIIGDYTAFDPFEGRLADFADEAGFLPEMMDFMTTNPDNPAPVERLKNALEGVMIGGAVDFLLFGLRTLKTLSLKKFKTFDRIAEEAAKNPKTAKAYSEAEQLSKALDEQPDRVEVNGNTVTEQNGNRVMTYSNENTVKNVGEAPGLKVVEPVKAQAKKLGNQKERTKRAFNIFKKVREGATPETEDDLMLRFQEYSDAQELQAHIYDEAEEIIDANRGYESWKATEAKGNHYNRLATITGGTEEGVMERMKTLAGDLQNASGKAMAMYKTLAKWEDEWMAACRKYDPDAEGAEHELIRLLEHAKMMEELQALCYGVRSEFGRGLNMHKINIKKSRFDTAEVLNNPDLTDYIQKNKTKIENMIKVAGNGKRGEGLKMARVWGKGGFMKWLLSYKQAALLWSPVTHSVNIASQTGALTLKMFNRSVAHAMMAATHMDWNYLRPAVGEMAGLQLALKQCFKGNPVKSAGKALKAAYWGDESFKKAFREDPDVGNFWKALGLKEGIIDPGLKVNDHMDASDMAAVEVAVKSKLGRMGSTINAVITTPFNALAGADEVFKTLGTQYEYYSLIYREGLDNGLRGKELDQFFNAQRQSVRGDLFNKALDVGREVTFQDRLGKMSEAINKGLSNNNLGLFTRFMAVPFYKTTVNVAKWALKSSPAALASSSFWKAMKEGGVPAYEMLSRVAMGTALMTAAWHKFEAGKLTGRIPRDQYDNWTNAGVQEYSEYDDKTGKWVSYRRSDPVGLLKAMAADFFMAVEMLEMAQDGVNDVDYNDAMGAFILCFVEPIVNSTWTKNAKDMFDMFANPERSEKSWKKFAVRQAEGLIPGTTGIDWINEAINQVTEGEPYLRQVNSIVDLLWKKVDSSRLLPKRNTIYGTPMKRVNRWATAIRQTEMTDDPVLLETLRVGLNVRAPKDEIRLIPGAPIEVTPEKIDEYMQIYSQYPIKESLEKLINSPGYKRNQSDAEKAKWMRGIIGIYRAAARAEFAKGNQELTDESVQKVRDHADAVRGLRTERNKSAAILKVLETYPD